MSFAVPYPSETQLLTAVRTLLTELLPAGAISVVGRITGDVLSVESDQAGALAVGDWLVGEGVVYGTVLVSKLTSDPETWRVRPAQSVASALDEQPVLISTGVPVLRGQANRVPEVAQEDFVIMTPVGRVQLGTNEDTFEDVSFMGSVAGDLLTVTDMIIANPIQVGQLLMGTGVIPGTLVWEYGTGVGGVGTYRVRPAQTLGSRKLASGGAHYRQPVQYTLQLDVHGPSGAEVVQVIATLMRDLVGVRRLRELLPAASPLYCGDPRQVPFINAEQQYENRWTVDLVLQVDETLRLPQDFADDLVIQTVDVLQEFTIP